MAILRSDQSQLTFAAEAAQGGDPRIEFWYSVRRRF